MRRCMAAHCMAVLAALTLAACGGDATGPHQTGEETCRVAMDEAIAAHGQPVSRDTTSTATETTVTLRWATPSAYQRFTWREGDSGCFEGLYQSE